MCGIAGIFSSDEQIRLRIGAMNALLSHRGPDAQSVWTEKRVSLAHSRLSIIDVSDAAIQPMFSANERYAIVFNGEVYNYRQLSEKLQHDFPEIYGSRGFRTQSDTEIVLELFSAYGTNSVNMLNVMFAYSIYDRLDEKLFLFRDRIGIKPLFYSIHNNTLCFASELRSLMQAMPSKTMNVKALPLYFHLGYFPEPHTVLNEANKFPAGCFASWDGHELKTECYWDAANYAKTKKNISFDDAKISFKSLLEEAVSDSLISDVPLGVFLSGGIDSSLVASVAASKASGKIKTFTVSSPNKDHDESKYARKIASHLQSEHFEMAANEKALTDLAEPLLQQMDEPLADSSFFPVFLISKFAREHVTVALGGDGGDELFQGYGTYRWAQRLSNPLLRIAKPLARIRLKNTRHAQFFNPALTKSFYSNIFSIEQDFFPLWELASLNLTAEQPFPKDISFLNNLSPANAQAFFDLTHYLKDDLLVKVDRASMLTSLEVRPPLLDHRLIEEALQLPLIHKIKSGESKYLLKEILSDYIPHELFDRPKKGFSIPMQNWLKNELGFLPERYLQNEKLRIFQLISFVEVRDILTKYRNGSHRWYYNRIWILVVLSLYLENHPEIVLPNS